MKKIHAFFFASLILLLGSCAKDSFDDEKNNPFKGKSAKMLFVDANKAISKEQYNDAIKRFEALESMYPFSEYAESAQMKLIYAYYQNQDYTSAAATAERFIHLYPRAANVDYAYYMMGLANFQQVRGTFATFLPLDESWRDPGTQSQAYTDFANLIQKFPNSRYKANAIQRMIYLRNTFAQHELHVANYYFDRKMYVAAIERANFLIKNYRQAPSTQQALLLIYKANKRMGLDKPAQEALATYQATYHQPG